MLQYQLHVLKTMLITILSMSIFAYGSSIEKTGHYGGHSTITKMNGSYLFTNEGETFVIYDKSDPKHLVKKGSVGMESFIEDLDVNGNYVYITNDRGWFVVNVQNVIHPYIQKMITGTYVAVTHDNGFVYLVKKMNETQYAMEIWRISQNGDPVKQTTYQLDVQVHKLIVDADKVYLAAYDSGLIIIDVSNKNSPSELARYSTNCYAMDVAIAGHFAYVANNNDGLLILDVSVLPSEVGRYKTEDIADAIDVNGAYAYIGERYNIYEIVDISNNADPKKVSKNFVGYGVKDILVDGNYMYVANIGGGLKVIDISDRTLPHVVGVYNSISSGENMHIVNGYAYIADGSNGLVIVDIRNKRLPVQVGYLQLILSHIYDVKVSGEFAYLVSGTGLTIVDISKPDNLQIVGSISTNGTAKGVYIKGNYAYVADGNNGLVVIDITDKSAPSLIGNYIPSDSVDYADIVVDGNFAYVLNLGDGLVILNISDLNAVSRVGNVSLGGYPSQLVKNGNYIYIATGQNGASIIDISDKTNPILVQGNIGGYRFDPTTYVEIAGNYLYVGNMYSMRIFNITDKNDPKLLWSSRNVTVGKVNTLKVEGDWLYMIDSTNGLNIFKTTYVPFILPAIVPYLLF